jgi:hypothetical protein
MKLLCAFRAYASDTFTIGEAAGGGRRLKPQNLVVRLPIEGSR